MGSYVEYSVLPELVAKLKREKCVTVITGATLDLGAHPLHQTAMNVARGHGEDFGRKHNLTNVALALNVLNDVWVSRHKDIEARPELVIPRPVFPEKWRAQTAVSSGGVDYVTVHSVFTESPTVRLVLDSNPHIYVVERDLPDAEAQQIERYTDTELVITPHIESPISTTNIIALLVVSYLKQQSKAYPFFLLLDKLGLMKIPKNDSMTSLREALHKK